MESTTKAIVWVAGLGAVLGGSYVVYRYVRRDPADLVTDVTVAQSLLSVKYDTGPDDTLALPATANLAALLQFRQAAIGKTRAQMTSVLGVMKGIADGSLTLPTNPVPGQTTGMGAHGGGQGGHGGHAGGARHGGGGPHVHHHGGARGFGWDWEDDGPTWWYPADVIYLDDDDELS